MDTLGKFLGTKHDLNSDQIVPGGDPVLTWTSRPVLTLVFLAVLGTFGQLQIRFGYFSCRIKSVQHNLFLNVSHQH